MPRHKRQLNSILTPKQVISDRNPKTRSMPIHRSCNNVIFGNPHNNQINFIQHWNQVKLHPPHLTSSQFGPPTQSSSQFACSHFKQVILVPRTKPKSLSATHTTTKSSSSLHWNQVKFDPLHWNQVNLDHLPKNQVNFHAHNTKKKWFWASTHETSQLLPPTPKPDQFHPYPEIKPSSIPVSYTHLTLPTNREV